MKRIAWLCLILPLLLPGAAKAQADVVKNGDFFDKTLHWTFQVQGGAAANISCETPIDANGNRGLPYCRTCVTTKTAQTIDVQFYQPGLVLDNGAAYRMEFFARSSQVRDLRAHVQKATTPFTPSFQQTFNLQTRWQAQPFALPFTNTIITDSTPSGPKATVTFVLGKYLGCVDISGVSLYRTN